MVIAVGATVQTRTPAAIRLQLMEFLQPGGWEEASQWAGIAEAAGFDGLWLVRWGGGR